MGRDDYYIGMTDLQSRYGYSGYKKRRKRRHAKKYVFRALVISVCVLLTAAIGAGIFFGVKAIIPDGSNPENNNVNTSAPTQATQSSAQTPTETQPDTESATVPVTTAPEITNQTLVFNKPNIKDNGGDGVFISGNVYLWNHKAFNIFGSSEKIAKNYSSAVGYIADKLGGDVTVYNMVIPNQAEFGLPQRISDSVGNMSQADNIKCIYENLKSNVKPINCYNALSAHCNEYLYFGTDHHWTALGAYYAYEEFCKETGLTPMTISDDKCESVSGFTGAFCTMTNSAELYANPDTVYFYDLPNDTYAYLRETPGSERLTVSVYYPGASSGTLTYGAFCWGDVSEFIIHSDCNTGRKIAVVKDSYGNAFVPYLTANYDEVHMIDFRYWKGNLTDYLKSNGIKEVLILNNTMSANAPTQVDMMKDLVG